MTKEKNVILTARDIVVEFDVRDKVLTAIRGVSLELVEGEVLALVGESGSGKSVLTKTFTGMLEENGRIAQGSIDYRGQDLTALSSHKEWEQIRGAKIATIFQDPMTSLDPIKTIGSQITEVIVKHQGKTAKEAKELAIDYMNKVGIPDADRRFNEYPFQYSGGMRQRIVIAIALACRPDVLICDEPTTALDVTIQAQIIDLLKSLQNEYHFTTIFITHDLGDEPISALDVSVRAQVLNLLKKFQKELGLTYLFIAHDLSVVRFISDRIAVIYKGVIVEVAETEELFNNPIHPYTQALLSAVPIPDPILERKKVLKVYDPSQHDYETDKPSMVEIRPGHYVWANQTELARYQKGLN